MKRLEGMHTFLIDWWYFDIFQNLVSDVLNVFTFFQVNKVMVFFFFQGKIMILPRKKNSNIWEKNRLDDCPQASIS